MMSRLDFAPYLLSLLAMAKVHAVAVMMPGPDFAMTMRNSLVYSKRTGLFGALGTNAGICIHVIYTLFGLSYISGKAPMVLEIIRYFGAGYLIYIGLQPFRTKGALAKQLNFDTQSLQKEDLTPLQAFRTGFMTNLLNPMVIILFVSVLSSYIPKEASPVVLFIYGFVIVGISTLWFSIVALCFSQEDIRQTFQRLGHWLEKLTGGLLIIFGLKIAFSSLNFK